MFRGAVHKKMNEMAQAKQKAFALLIDPDSVHLDQLKNLAEKCNKAKVDHLFIGGSLMVSNHLADCINAFKAHSNIPVSLFPGSPNQVSPDITYFWSQS